MKRSVVIFAAILAVIVVAVLVLFLRTLTQTPAGQVSIPPVSYPPDSNVATSSQQPSGRSQGAVQSIFRNGIAPYVKDNLRLQQTVIAGDYALQVWSSDTMGGEALLKYDSAQNHWVFVTAGGGVWSVDGLVEAGVPRDAAATLFAGVPH